METGDRPARPGHSPERGDTVRGRRPTWYRAITPPYTLVPININGCNHGVSELFQQRKFNFLRKIPDVMPKKEFVDMVVSRQPCNMIEHFLARALPQASHRNMIWGRVVSVVEQLRSGRTMARTGLRMMPTFPSSPLRFRTAGFPQYGSKAGLSDRAFPDHASVKLAPSMLVTRSGLHPSFVLSAAAWVLRSESEATCSVEHRHASDIRRSTPGALAPVRVLLSRSIIT